ncbi:MAG: hypothetical protein EZS28_028814 [Streblomastix strix]|uniref:DDE-1 domain-containing protein n=1 Tax=Streblomastix strix TaxID=222440 RepID=A0A5J4UZ21_9EUKA|nr:MAG: hypothetical protein EZS28_028814 [Streblomastix strix]
MWGTLHILITTDIHQEPIQRHNEERLIAVTRATQLGFPRIAEEFRTEDPNLTRQYVMDFMSANKISFSIQSTSDIRRQQASLASNINNWFNQVYSEQVFEGCRNRSIFNMNETNLNYQTRCRTAKEVGSKRSISASKENLVGHISLALTVSPGFRQLPSFVILGNLVKVPLFILHESTNEEVVIDVLSSGFMVQDVFRRRVRQFCKWVRVLKIAGYFEQQEKIVLFQDGHKSRGDDTASELLKEE